MMKATNKAIVTAVAALTLAVVAAACSSDVSNEESSQKVVPTPTVARRRLTRLPR